MDARKHVDHWRSGADEAIDVARALADGGRLRYALFFAHLAIEKILKAEFTRHTGDVAPKTHHLMRLAEAAGVPCDEDMRRFLLSFNVYQIEGRYGDPDGSIMEESVSRADLERALEVFAWLRNRF